MKIKIIAAAAALFACLLSTDLQAQDDKVKMDVDTYIASGKNIIIGKILSTSPVKRGGDYGAAVEILHVVKGSLKRGEIRVVLKWTPVEDGKIYLLRTENDLVSKYESYFLVKGRDSAIELAPYTDIEEMKTLSVRIAVLRTMNLRKDHLENEIRQLTSELERLKQLTKEQ